MNCIVKLPPHEQQTFSEMNFYFLGIDIFLHFSSIDLPNFAASVYSIELCNRLRGFLSSCPPSSPSPHVTELLIAAADFERDLQSWNIRCVIKEPLVRKSFLIYTFYIRKSDYEFYWRTRICQELEHIGLRPKSLSGSLNCFPFCILGFLMVNIVEFPMSAKF